MKKTTAQQTQSDVKKSKLSVNVDRLRELSSEDLKEVVGARGCAISGTGQICVTGPNTH